MADIQLRFGKDVLVIGGAVQNQLAGTLMPLGTGEDDEGLLDIAGASLPAGSTEVPTDRTGFDVELSLMLEPEVFEEAFGLQKAAGAQCVVAPTANLTPARLAHTGMRAAAEDLARTAVQVASLPAPEHVLVELAPCGLPLDAASKASLMENRAQYERAARLFDGLEFDAFFLNGFTSVADLKCALMGIRKVSDAPVIASVDVNVEGMLAPLTPGTHRPFIHESLEEAVAVMAEFGAQVAGFCTVAGPDAAVALAERVANTAFVPVLAQLAIASKDAQEDICASTKTMVPDDRGCATGSLRTLSSDEAFDAALLLANVGVQFLRATGAATPAYTGAMAAAVFGMSACNAGTPGGSVDAPMPSGASLAEDASLADRLRQSVNDALGIGGTE